MHRYMKFHLRSSDQLLVLDIPQSGGIWLYEILTSDGAFVPSWPAERNALEDVLVDRGFKAVADFRMLITGCDYSIYRHFPRKPVFVVMLRHPVNRVTALYNQYRHTSKDAWNAKSQTKGISLRDFLTLPTMRAEANGQIRRLVGVHQARPELTETAMLEVASFRLEEFAFFGLVEHLEESRKLLSHTFDLNIEAQRGQLLDPLFADVSQISPVDELAIRRLNGLDLQLYEMALRKLRRRLEWMAAEKLAARSAMTLPFRVSCSERKRSGQTNRIARRPWMPAFGRLRRRLIPEGSRCERIYLRLRRRVFGW